MSRSLTSQMRDENSHLSRPLEYLVQFQLAEEETDDTFV